MASQTETETASQPQETKAKESRLFPPHLPFRETPDRDAIVRFNEEAAIRDSLEEIRNSWINGIVNSESMTLTTTPDKIRELAYFGATELRQEPRDLTDSTVFRTCLRWLIVFQHVWLSAKNDTDLRLLALSWNELLHHGPQSGDQRALFLDHAVKSYQQFYEASPTDNNFKTATILGRIMVQEAITPRQVVQAHKRMGLVYGVRISKFNFSHGSWRPIINTSIHNLNIAIAKLEECPDLEPVASDKDMYEQCAWALDQRGEGAGQEEDTNKAIDYYTKLVERAKDDEERLVMQDKLARAYWKHFTIFHKVQQATEGIAMFEKILEIDPENPHALSGCAELLRQKANAENITNAARRDVTTISIGMLERCVAATSDDDKALPSRLGKLSEALMERYGYDADPDDIDMSIALHITAMDLPQLPAGAKYFYHKQLSEKYTDKFKNSGDVADIEEAVRQSQQAIEWVAPKDNSEKGKVYLGLARTYAAWYASRQRSEHIELAIRYGEDSLKLFEEDGWRSISALDDLAKFYRSRFDRTRQYDDAAKGIKYIREAISRLRGLAGKNNLSHEANSLGVLAKLMRSRASAFKAEEDFNEAVRAERDALKLTDPEHAEYTSRAADLSYNLTARYRVFNDLADLKEADNVLNVASQYLSTRKVPASTKERGLIENQHGIVYVCQWTAQKDVKWAREAVKHFKAALLADAADLVAAQNLASTLTGIAKETTTLQDALVAVQAFQTYVLSLDKYAPETLEYQIPIVLEQLSRLAVSKIHEASAMKFWLPMAIKMLDQLIEAKEASADARLWANGERAVIAAVTHKDFSSAAKYIAQAAAFLPLILNPALSRLDQVRLAKEHSSLPGFVLGFQIAAGYPISQALQAFEQVRGILWNRLLRENDELDALADIDPSLANEFRELHTRISAPRKPIASLENDTSMVYNNTDYYQDAQRYNEAITKIRSIPGNEDFLKLSSQASELTSLAGDGALVLVNTAANISHAIIVISTGITILELPHYHDALAKKLYRMMESALDLLGKQETAEANNIYKSICLTLWQVIAFPVIEKLDELLPENSIDQWKPKPVHRIYWITNQLMNVLPLHAAGDHNRHKDTQESCTLLDRSISSYIPSFGSLKFALKNAATRSQQNAPASGLIVSMSSTPGQADLPYASEEAFLISADLSAAGLSPTTLENSQAHKKSILSSLSSCRIAHFITHGQTSPSDPLKSSLLHSESHKGEKQALDVKSLIRAKIPSCEMVYLSVCSAAASETLPLVDEGLHVAGGFLMAGVPVVVGTRWELVDEIAVRVAKRFYGRLLDGKKVDVKKAAGVLRATLLEVREESVLEIFWGAFVVYGV